MREEILLEVIDHRDGLVEETLSPTTVHEDSLGTEHLRDLCQHRCAPLSDEPVGELTHEWVGGDARETVGATTLQTDAQF